MSRHNKDQQQQREVAIFWDYENVRLPRFCGSAAVAAKAIGKTVATYGRIVDRRLYYDFSKNNCGKYLDSSGFDLVNTPSRYQKETLDKKLIADVLTFAWDSTLRNHTKPCVVLITGDGDYAYTLSKLRDRGIMTVVMTGENCSVASILVETADCALSLEHDVLFPKDTTTSVNNNNTLTLTAAPTTPTTPLPCNPINPVDMDFVRVICQILRSTVSSHVDGWVNMVHMSTHNHDDVKQRARTIRDQAVAMGVMELGRRRCGTKSTIVSITNRPPNRKMGGSLSNEVYGRLLPQGEQLLLDAPPHELSKNHPVAIDKAKNNKNNTTWFLKYVPPSVSLSELVAHMETTLQVEVRRARVETNPFGKRSAHVELTPSTRLPNYISYQTHAIQVYTSTQRNPFPRFWRSQTIGSNPSYYESKQHPSILQENHDDSLLFCRAMVDAGAGPQHWINAGLVGTSFRQLLALDFLHHATTIPKRAGGCHGKMLC